MNGVPLAQMAETVEALKNDPGLARFQFRARNQWVSGGHNVSRKPELWAARIGGAPPEPELAELARATGFVDSDIVARYRPFANTSAEAKLSKDIDVQSVGFVARKPVH